MNIWQSLRDIDTFTPTEQQLAKTVLSLGERIQDFSIKEFAVAAAASIPSVHRFCKKLGLEGFKQLKVEIVRASVKDASVGSTVDINFPFGTHDSSQTIMCNMFALYDTVLNDTQELLGNGELDRAATLLKQAQTIDIYTQSHNLYPAQMFCDRLLSCGISTTCFEEMERLQKVALASNAHHVALMISYSGMGSVLESFTPALKRTKTPIILIGTEQAKRLNPGLDVYLRVSNRESLQNRITQFASHIAVQYVLDCLFGTLFAKDFDSYLAFLRQSTPYHVTTSSDMSPEAYRNYILDNMK